MLVLAEMSMMGWLIIDVFIFAILWRLLRFILFGRISWPRFGARAEPAAEVPQAARVRITKMEPEPDVVEVIDSREALPPPSAKYLDVVATVEAKPASSKSIVRR